MTYVVYVLLCRDGTYYTGSTNDLEKRIKKHNSPKSGAKYTRHRRPVILHYVEDCGSYSLARKREGEIKRLSKQQKEMLSKK